jgi:hypothetical protein
VIEKGDVGENGQREEARVAVLVTAGAAAGAASRAAAEE